MSKQLEKLKEVIKKEISLKLKKTYVSCNEEIQQQKISEIGKIIILKHQVDMESLLANGKADSILIKVGFKANVDVVEGVKTTKIFEFDCRISASYNQIEKLYLVNHISKIFPRESSTLHSSLFY